MADPINEIVPGQPMTEKQRAELANANLAETNEAHRMAAEQRARDIAGGQEAPLLPTIADSILDKLKALPPEKPAE